MYYAVMLAHDPNYEHDWLASHGYVYLKHSKNWLRQLEGWSVDRIGDEFWYLMYQGCKPRVTFGKGRDRS